MVMIKVLNLYGGLGGNRKLWGEQVTVTTVEWNKKIAGVYAKLWPNDELVIADAHAFLLQHYKEYDFIWSSPPCQSHTRMIRSGRNRKPRYPDMALYEEIIFLKSNFAGQWVVENVIPYYDILMPAKQLGRHMFWANFPISTIKVPEFENFISKQNKKEKLKLMEWLGIHFEENIYYEGNHCPTQVLRNCVHPIVGKHVFECAVKRKEGLRIAQGELF